MPRTPVRGTRLDVLERLEDPVAHFPPQRRPDALAHGVDAGLVAAKPGVPRRAAGSLLRRLVALGLLRTSRIRRRTHHRRDEGRTAEAPRLSEKGRQPPDRSPSDPGGAPALGWRAAAAGARGAAVGPAVPEPRHRCRQRSLLANGGTPMPGE